MMRSYLNAYPSALNANKNSEDEMLITSKYMLSPNEKTNNIIISDAAYDTRVKSFFRVLMVARHI